jgi:hypothetical protein
MPPEPPDVTDLLLAWGGGDQSARDQLAPLVYDELRRLAQHYLRQERPEHTLQPTALVHEAWLRLVQTNRMTWPQPRALHRRRGGNDATHPGGSRAPASRPRRGGN